MRDAAVDVEHVLFVCTGNLCRSPLAEVLLRRRLAERCAGGVVVSSAGTWAGSAPAPLEARAVAGELGCDLGAHRARRIDAGLVASSDLVVGMTADHLIDMAHQVPGEHARMFKLSELGRLAGLHEARRAGESLRAFAERLGDDRPDRVWAASHRDPDVSDPFGAGTEAFRRIAAEIDGLLEPVVAAAWPTP